MPDRNDDVVLKALNIWPDMALERLGSVGIVNADHLIAVAHTDGGVASLSQQTGLAPEEVRRLIVDTQAAMMAAGNGGFDPAPVDTRNFGMGAFRPDE